MKKTKVFKGSKVVSLTLALLLVVLFLFPLQSEAGVCEEALVRCSIDALVVGLFSGFSPGLLFALGCATGYEWCLVYYL